MANCSQPLADISEFLREQQCDGEIHHQKDGKNETGCRNPIHLHGLPQLLACLDVEKRQSEENSGVEQHEYVLHAESPELRPGIAPARLLKTRFQLDALGTKQNVRRTSRCGALRTSPIASTKTDSEFRHI